MHDVLDPRDLVPDEAEQLCLSGYPAEALLLEARSAAASGDRRELAALGRRLAGLERSGAWAYDEPSEESVVLDLLADVPDVTVDGAAVPDRVRGGWLGRAVGNTLGKPVEGLARTEIETYLQACQQWPLSGYLPLLDPLPEGVPQLHPSAPSAAAGRFEDVPRDDDLDWTMLNLWVLETHGPGFTTDDVAAAWLDRMPFMQTYTAERAAYRNLVHGIRPPATAVVDNPYREWIGALIRADVFGYVAPGRPSAAARMAMTDARLTHTANGLYGEMWAAALVAAALACDSARDAIEVAHAVLPPRSRLAVAIEDVRRLHDSGADETAALDLVDESWGRYPWVHTVNNAALVAVGLLWGTTFVHSVGITLAGGRDTDSNCATVGSVFGALQGAGAVPGELVGTTHHRVRSAVRDFDRVTIAELAERTLRVGQRVAAWP